MLCATVSDNSTIGLDLGFRSQGLTADCRICLEEGNDFSETGLIAPCYCAGSVRYVHFRCLSDWILRTKKDSIGESGKKITFECEMCKHFIYYEQRV